MRSADRSFGEFLSLPTSSAQVSARGGIASAGAVGLAGGVRSAAGVGADTPKFGALYQQLQREVTRYIEQGSDSQGSLSPEGAWRRQQMAVGASAGSTAAWGTGSALLEDTVASSALRGLNAAGTGATAPSASPAQQQAFVNDVLPLAREAASRLGVAPEVLTAQAALETGWGRAPIRRADAAAATTSLASRPVEAGPAKWPWRPPPRWRTVRPSPVMPASAPMRRRPSHLTIWPACCRAARGIRRLWGQARMHAPMGRRCSAAATPPIRLMRTSWRVWLLAFRGARHERPRRSLSAVRRARPVRPPAPAPG